MTKKPTHEQAQLHLQIYDMRREPRLRQARDWFFKNYFADSFHEAMRIAPPGTEAGTFAMMVFGYWDWLVRCSITACFTKICSSRPAASFFQYGSASNPVSRRAAGGG